MSRGSRIAGSTFGSSVGTLKENTGISLVGAVTFGEICRRTRMLKSLVNRTIGTLASRGFLERRTGEDKRTTYVVPVKKKLPEFLEEHERSLALARRIIGLIGEEDARTFCRIAEKVFNADPLPDHEKDD